MNLVIKARCIKAYEILYKNIFKKNKKVLDTFSIKDYTYTTLDEPFNPTGDY